MHNEFVTRNPYGLPLMTIGTIETNLWLVFRLSLLGICVALLINRKWLGNLQKKINVLFGTTDLPALQTKEAPDLPRQETSELTQPDDPGTSAITGTQHTTYHQRQKTPSKKQIGQILLEKNLITKPLLDEALDYQKQHGGTLTQYLLQSGHIDEKQLAQCLCEQFKVPYLPIDSYEISDEVIDLIPTDIAEKYWILPLEKTGDILTVAMIDPLDAKAIKELENLTSLKIMPIVAVISEILTALQSHYKILNQYTEANSIPFFIKTICYTGRDRRRAVRYPAKIGIQFPLDGDYIKTTTNDVSRYGLSFYSPRALALGEVINVQINLPRDIIPLPIAAISKIMRCALNANGDYELGAEILKIGREELDCILKYAMDQKTDPPADA